jgi:hypothetical protein
MNRTNTFGVSFDTLRSPSRAERIARLDALATLLDTAFVVPGTQIRFGLDALIGLVPGIGDVITTAMALYIVNEARALGAPRLLVARMVANVALDGLVGACRWSATRSTSRSAPTGATWRCCAIISTGPKDR